MSPHEEEEAPKPAAWTEKEIELRSHLDPDPARARQMARAALEGPGSPTPNRLPAWAAAAAIVALLLTGGALLLPRDQPYEAPSASNGASSASTPSPGAAGASSYQLVNTGGVVAVTTRAGQVKALVAGGES